MSLEELNQGDSKQACIELLKCCGSIIYVNNILAARTFSSVAHLHMQAEKIWFELGKEIILSFDNLVEVFHKGEPLYPRFDCKMCEKIILSEKHLKQPGFFMQYDS